jgi:hypothetical protein
MTLEAEIKVFLDEKTCTVDEKTQGNELQKEFGLMRVLTKREETLVIGLFKVLPTGRKVLEKLLVNFFVPLVNLQADLPVSSIEKIAF